MEEVYIEFQGKKPVGYSGHSLSVSDIVDVDGVAYYCDSFGFEKIEF